MEKPFSYMLEHPWLIAVAALVAYFLLRPSQSGGDDLYVALKFI